MVAAEVKLNKYPDAIVSACVQLNGELTEGVKFLIFSPDEESV
jgi:hypothetical protein